MSELISDTQPEPAPRTTGPSGHVAYGGPDAPQYPGIVVRYDAIADPTDQADDLDADEVDDPDADAEEVDRDDRPGTEVSGRARAILGAVVPGLLALCWVLLRAAYRYPRWALVILLSVVILGATAMTRSDKTIPTASLPNGKPAAPSPDPEKPKETEEPKPKPEAVAKAAPTPKPEPEAVAKAAPTPRPEPEKKEEQPREATPVAEPTRLADTNNVPATPASDVKAPPAFDPPTVDKGPVSAPPQLPDEEVAARPPAPAGQAVAATPTTDAAEKPRPDPGLPLLPAPELGSAPAPAPAAPSPSVAQGRPAEPIAAPPVEETRPAPPAETPGRPAGLDLPLPGGELKLTGGLNAGNASAPAPSPSDSAAGGTPRSAQPPAAPPESPSPPPVSPTPSEAPATPPLSPVPSGSAEPQAPAPKPDPPAPAPATKAEPPRPQESPAGPAPGVGAGNEHPAPPAGSEPAHPAPPEARPEPHPVPPDTRSEPNGEPKLVELPQPQSRPSTPENPGRAAPAPEGPTRPATPPGGPEPPVLGAGRIEKDGTGAARQPNVPEEKGPAPGHEGSPTASPEATSRPETIHPEDGRPSPKAQPSAAVPARPEEPPGPTATVPPPEPDASRSPGRPSGDGATGDGPSTSASGPSASSTADLAATGWVRITNKGRLPADLRDDPGGSGHRGPGLEPDRRGRDEAGLGHESGSIATPSTGEKDRATAESVGLGTTATNLRPAEGSRADLGSMRVRPKLHIVERGENFWSISQLYYGDGRRYYRALWKANSRKYPNIREIHINDVIEIPAVEDLDPAYIVSPPSRPVASRPDGSEEASPSGPERPSSFPTTRAARLSVTADDALARRSDPELELPIAEPEPATARGGRFPLADRSGTGEGRTPLPSSRSTARPLDGDQGERPVYKVRPYDTLRSIARDFLGDPRRADEIYEINRDVIADPTRLTAGLLLELPEDADTRRVTIRERYRGRD